MKKSIVAGFVFLFLIFAFSSGNGVAPEGGPESTVTPDNEHQMAPANSYTPHAPITISSDADFSTQGWPGNGSLGNPYVIAGLNITADAVCINIVDVIVYFEIKDCILSSGVASSYDGIVLDNVTHGIVLNCIIDQHFPGIHLFDSSNCTLTNNTTSNNRFILEYSNDCTLTNNTDGFSLYYSNNCTLTNNTASSNSNDGFHLTYSNNCTLTHNTASSNSNDGFDLNSSDNCTLMDNTAYSNFDSGFHLSYSNNCTLTHNTASSNAEYGVNLMTGSENNILYLNWLGNNGVSNAQDDGSSNFWDDGVSSGNYWMDYSGTGTYPIPGSAGSVDNYPFRWEIAGPTVDSPSDIEYIEGVSGNSITWSPNGDYPEIYTIYRNSTVIVSGAWNGSQIIVDVDGLSPEVYNYTLVVTDGGGNSATDTVLVTVLKDTTTTTTTTTTTPENGGTMLILILSGVGIAAVVIVIILVLRKKGV